VVCCRALLTRARFYLQNHIVDLDRDIKAPQYVEDHPLMDLSSLEQKDHFDAASDDNPDEYTNVDVLRDFPKKMKSSMDRSQMLACEKMLTNCVSIVQGPPGTGKTYTSVSTLKVMIGNLYRSDPPLIVAAQTNHALDQLLNHILTFEPNILRLGGRSNKANEDILKRTLFELRNANPIPGGRAGFRAFQIELVRRVNDVKSALESLLTGSLLTADTLLKQGLITESQFNSLSGSSDWEGDDTGGDIAECKNRHTFSFCWSMANLDV
jgi:helicase required for RNAi-mediated heterochromatin assembly 1